MSPAGELFASMRREARHSLGMWLAQLAARVMPANLSKLTFLVGLEMYCKASKARLEEESRNLARIRARFFGYEVEL